MTQAEVKTDKMSSRMSNFNLGFKLDKKYDESHIKNTSFTVQGKTTICTATLLSGFEMVGTSSPMKHEDFNGQIGRQISYERVVDKLFELFAFLYSTLKHQEASKLSVRAQMSGIEFHHRYKQDALLGELAIIDNVLEIDEIVETNYPK